MRLNDKVYDCLKWLALVAIPALAVLISVVLPAWNLAGDYVKPIVITLNAIGVFIGTLIGISQATIAQDNAKEEYFEKPVEDEEPIEDEPDEEA